MPRLATTNENRTGWPLSEAWKLVPKSTAKAWPEARPRLSKIPFAVTPAENRSEKFWENVSPANVSLTEYVAPVPSTGGKTLVSAGISVGIGTDLQGGARWSRDGRELFYMSADRRLMTVPIRTTPMIEVGTPVPLFTFPERAWSDFAVSADGKRFLAVVPQAFAGEQPLTVILNWTAEVRR